MLNDNGNTNLLIIILFLGFIVIFALSVIFGGGHIMVDTVTGETPSVIETVEEVPMNIISMILSLLLPLSIAVIFIILIVILMS